MKSAESSPKSEDNKPNFFDTLKNSEGGEFLDRLVDALTDSGQKALDALQEHHRTVVDFAKSLGVPVERLTQNLVTSVSSTGLSAALLASSVISPMATNFAQNVQANYTPPPAATETVQQINKKDVLTNIQQTLATTGPNITTEQAATLAGMVSQVTDVKATHELDGYQLNKSFGKIGGEQHMPMYPGDTVASQLPDPSDYAKYAKSGMTPGKSAWGYFAPSKAAVTPDLIEKEKYYFAVQTFLSPNWKGNIKDTYKWFKYRKVVALNPTNGKAIVGDIADAGPAEWVGKAYGGSPEVMQYIRAWDKPAKGEILLFFVDDPENKIPLGPVNINY